MHTIITHWLATAPRGAELTYHTGCLYRDRVDNAELDGLATFVWDLYTTGACSLRQRPHGRGCDYCIINLPHSPVTWHGCYKHAAD